MELFRSLNEQGTTIVQVTHSEVNASYGNRLIELRDGWMTSNTAIANGAKAVSASDPGVRIS